MIFANIHLPTTHNDAFLHSSREQIAIWFLLICYCSEQENGGRIKGAKNWAPMTWTMITRGDFPGSSPLWKWEGDDLVVLFYQIKDQIKLQFQRQSAQMARMAIKRRNRH